MDIPFLPVNRPRGYERQRIADAHYQHLAGKKIGSAPISTTQLQSAKSKMMPEQFNWMFISLWLGLRPQEIDNLKNRNLWSIEELKSGTKILWVFQTKLVALPSIDRWKPIPLIYAEQIDALSMIDQQKFDRPLMKTVRKNFGDGVSLYAGRKGFADLMLEKGNSLEAISLWMGHSTISRTWRTYKDRRGVKFSIVS